MHRRSRARNEWLGAKQPSNIAILVIGAVISIILGWIIYEIANPCVQWEFTGEMATHCHKYGNDLEFETCTTSPVRRCLLRESDLLLPAEAP